MCDGPGAKGRIGWAGWLEAPARNATTPSGPWIDLTHPFGERVPRSALFPPPKLSAFAQMPEQPLNVTRLDTIVHTGTHVDSPRHFYVDGPGMEAVPLDRLMGQGVVAKVEKPVFGAIEARDLQSVAPVIEEGDIVAIETGWSTRWGTPDWNCHPHLSVDAAEWLVEKKVKLVALDTATPDLAFDRRGPDFDFPVHCALLKYGVLIAEQVANLDRLSSRRAEFMFCAIPIADCDGAPARVLARPIG